MTKKRVDHEFQEQKALFQWRDVMVRAHPELKLLEGSMNGVRLSTAQAGKAKAAGMLKGSHDITLPVARGGYIGLSIELKVGHNKPSTEQIQVGSWLAEEGHLVRYCWGWEAAREEIVAYLALPRTIPNHTT